MYVSMHGFKVCARLKIFLIGFTAHDLLLLLLLLFKTFSYLVYIKERLLFFSDEQILSDNGMYDENVIRFIKGEAVFLPVKS